MHFLPIEIKNGLQADTILSFPELYISQISFDTRTIHSPENHLFIALQGHRDGHAFITEAYQKGVRSFVVSHTFLIPPIEANWYVVADTQRALQQWATSYRKQLQYPIIAITGSNGKTIVKEWLAQMLQIRWVVAKSPLSFNSQIGVPLSILSFPMQADFGIIEAGISEIGEMKRLQQMIQPNIGIFTHLGEAHAQGFDSKEEKLQEKLQLFDNCPQVFIRPDQPLVIKALQDKHIHYELPCFILKWAEGSRASISHFSFDYHGTLYTGEIECWDKASRNNLELVWNVAIQLGIKPEEIISHIADIQPIEMRTEIITDNPELTIIHDAYTADMDSVLNSLQLLKRLKRHPEARLILSDLATEKETRAALEQAILFLLPPKITAIGPISMRLAPEYGIQAYMDTAHFLEQWNEEHFRFHTVLLKGERKFRFEQILPYLTHKATATYLKINLSDLVHNYRLFQKKLQPPTQMMVMLKAAAYGAGSWEIAEALSSQGLDYIGVAYTSEGISLRKQGITLPIMVMNPDIFALEQLYVYNLEPAVGSFIVLEKILRIAKPITIHIEIETGMSRLGFLHTQLEQVIALLIKHPAVKVKTAFSHLAASDSSWEDEFSQQQFSSFINSCQALELYFPDIQKHILNTSGILRFPSMQLDMVRLGIGLYGYNPCPEIPIPLREIASLHTQISRIISIPTGTSVGYSRTDVVKKASLIATIPVGYADGIPRKLGNGKMYCLLSNEYKVPVIGRICMDMMMLDITDVPQAKEGDEVLVFGNTGDFTLSVSDIAEAAETISYEILTGIAERVRRVYVWE